MGNGELHIDKFPIEIDKSKIVIDAFASRKAGMNLNISSKNFSARDIYNIAASNIIMPNGKIDNFDLNRTESIKAKSELNEYDKYYIKEEYPIGRYFVDGTFWWNGMNVLSDTNKNDFFDVVEGE